MSASKNAQLFAVMAFFFLQMPMLAVASIETDLEKAKETASSLLSKKFSYNGYLNGSYGFADKKLDPEDVEALNDLVGALKKITYPKQLSSYSSIYIATDSEKKTTVKIFKNQNTIFISGLKLEPLELIQFFSSRPEDEKTFQELSQKKREDTESLLSKHMNPELLKSLISIVDTRCADKIQSKDEFAAQLENKNYKLLPKVVFQVPEGLPAEVKKHYREIFEKASEKEERTLRLETDKDSKIILTFETDKSINFFIETQEPNQTLNALLSSQCLLENMMLRTIKEKIVTQVLHFDKDLNVTKKVSNNQQRIEGQNKKNNLTPVATLDSGLDYNHPSVVNNLLSSKLSKDESLLYEKSKENFIKNAEIREAFKKRREKIEFELKYAEIGVQRSQENYNRNVQDFKTTEGKLKEAAIAIADLKEKLPLLQATLKPLEADKLLMFKAAKQAQIRKIRQEISSLSYNLNSLESDQSYLQERMSRDKSSVDKAYIQLQSELKKKETFLLQLSQVENDEAQHDKMIDIFTRGVTAWNFFDDNDTPSDFWDGDTSVIFASYDHGTHVAGIILNGAEDELAIFPMRYPKQPTLDFNNSKEKKVYQAVELAYKKGVRVINISMGTFAPESKTADEKLKNDKNARDSWRSIEKASKDFPDMLFVCAAGNDGKNTDERGHYPSDFESTNILSIAAVDNKNVLAKFSNYGKRTVDLAAPGVDIVSMVPGGEFGIKSGTSMATPFAARVAGRIEHINPNLTPEDIKEILGSTVKRTAELEAKTLYGGAIDEKKAIQKACSTLPIEKRVKVSSCK
jgi:subtilisin family serine protease